MKMMGKLSCLALLLLCGPSAAEGEESLLLSPWQHKDMYGNMGICWIMGNPHYRTFDKHYYNFMGNCTYVMATSHCSDSANVPYFEVEVKNEKHLKSEIPNLEMVVIRVYDYTVVFYRTEYGIVRLDDNLWNLPLHLADGKINIVPSGMSVLLTTDFGLSVQYDWEQFLVVMVPDSFKGKTCGLCGNFNGRDGDDLLLPSGSPANSLSELGKSWRVSGIAGDTTCLDECHGQCGQCEHGSFLQHLTGKVFCKIMTQVMNGPLRECSAVIPKNIYQDYCNFDLCMGKSMKKFLCDTLHVFTDACQRAGFKVLDWTSLAGCPAPQCPKNSHFDLCASACPTTCDSPQAPSTCDAPCVAGCVCDDGFVRRGNKCVPQAQCGCLYEKTGSYVEPGKTFWTDSCIELCTCGSNGGKLSCIKTGCTDGQECRVVKGIRGCYATSHGTCTISGDPHYKTFDNHFYSFQGTCTYTTAKACHIEGSHLQPFTVVVENEKWQKTELSAAKAVAVEVYGQTLILRKNEIGVVMVDGVLMNLPVNLNNGQVEVYQDGTHDVIKTDFGLVVTYDLVYRITITVPGSYHGKTCGLCGNFNGNEKDEYLLPDGRETKSIKDFGAAWKESVHGVVCDDGCTGDYCPKCAEDKKQIFESDCSIIKNPSGPFAACLSVIDPESYFRDCVYDVCMGDGDRNMLCHSIAAYVADCQDFGVDIKDWRTPSFCPLSCPPNSFYQICAQTCDSPCPGLSTVISCPVTCAEGCACNSEYYFNGTGCIKWDECGCYYDGRTYKIGETVIDEHCSERITCQPSGIVRREPIHCKSGEACTIKYGVRGCFILPHQCIMEDGVALNTGESKINEDCTERITCQPSGTVRREPIHCNSNEVCQVKNGVRGCYTQPNHCTLEDGRTLKIGESKVNEDCTERITCQPSGIVRHEPIHCKSNEVCTVKYGVRGCFPMPKQCTMEDGGTLRIGESKINEDCTERITCLPSGTIRREPIHCNSDEVCEVKNGIRGCYARPDHCTMEDGGTLKIGESKINEDCTERITCQPSGIVRREPIHCNNNEVCQVRNGIRGCYTRPDHCTMEDGGTLKIGESKINEDCTERITCLPSGIVYHEPIHCNSDEVCEVKNDIRGCYARPDHCTMEDGGTLKIGESKINEDCTERITCQPSGTVRREPIHCNNNEVCQVRNSIRGCYTRPDHCTMEDGGTLKIGESKVNEDCTERITCQPSGTVRREPIHCNSNEVCTVKYGVRGCFPMPKQCTMEDGGTLRIGESKINEDCTERITCLPSGTVRHEPIHCNSDEVCEVKNGIRGCYTRPNHCTMEDGGTLKIGESKINEDCTERITCLPSGTIRHEPIHCNSNEICQVKNGIRGCYARPNHCTMEDGRTLKIGESKVNEDCTERITCQPSGIVRREPIHCKSDEVCTVKYGVRGCFPMPKQCTMEDGGTLRIGESKINEDCTERITCLPSGTVRHEPIHCNNNEVCQVRNGIRGCYTRPNHCTMEDGGTLKIGESKINEDCTESITCQPSGTVRREPIHCNSNEVCQVKNGVRGCYARPDHCTMEDGRTLKIGESKVNEDCTERITCQPSGTVRREPIHCKSDEVCTVKYGVRGCFPMPKQCTMEDGGTLRIGESKINEDCTERITCLPSGTVRHEPIHCNSDEVCEAKNGIRGCYTRPNHCTMEDGGTLKIGESKISEDCTERITCLPSGTVRHEPIHCNSDEVCEVKNGVRGCYTRPDHCTMEDGGTLKIGESKINEDCTERITCQPSGIVRREPIHCNSNEVCQVRNGIRGCYTRPDHCTMEDGGTIKIGESKINEDCTERITCQPSGIVRREPIHCNSNEVCQVRNGIRGCHTRPNQCSMMDGGTLKIGESKVNEDCTERITCLPSGIVRHEPIHCKSDEVCEVKNGVRGCYAHQCLIEAGGALTMFGGMGGDIDVTGFFEIVEVCDGALVEEWFRVVVRLEECGHPGLRRVEAVYVYFDALVITVDAKHQTWVNGRKINLPSLLKNEFSVKISEKTVVIEKVSALRVTYSVTQEITVTVSDHFADKLCGACGKVTGDASITIDSKSIRKWMDKWRAPDFPSCEL